MMTGLLGSLDDWLEAFTINFAVSLLASFVTVYFDQYVFARRLVVRTVGWAINLHKGLRDVTQKDSEFSETRVMPQILKVLYHSSDIVLIFAVINVQRCKSRKMLHTHIDEDMFKLAGWWA